MLLLVEKVVKWNMNNYTMWKILKWTFLKIFRAQGKETQIRYYAVYLGKQLFKHMNGSGLVHKT